jgi:hypothetical protein
MRWLQREISLAGGLESTASRHANYPDEVVRQSGDTLPGAPLVALEGLKTADEGAALRRSPPAIPMSESA